jgi:uncharacterized surface protein with fasciclin (FAS1) repeats
MKNLFKIKMFALVALVILGFTSCNDDDDAPVVTPPDTTITNLAVNTPNLSTLVKALTRTDLANTLKGAGPFTVFAPTNDAFNTLFTALGPNVTVDNVDVSVLKSILLNHVIASNIKSADIPASTYVKTLSPRTTAANAPTLSMFVQKSGSTVTLNGGINNKGAVVTTADIIASNGVIHIVNKVIQLPTIKDHAVANPNFSTLVSLLVEQNLAATLDGTAGSPFTVFAPLNSAFDTPTLSLYGGLTSAQKTSVLLYHVVGNANVISTAIPTGAITTLEGGTFSITGTVIDDESTTNKNIVLTDVQCSNGIVHAIDKVLIPNF